MSTFLTAEWRKLIMAQYAIDPDLLAPYLPGGLELDLYGPQQTCFVSLVGFLFTRVRLLGLPIPFHTSFEEVNLRFYVKRPRVPGQPDGYHRRGVVFIREIVPKPAITFIARALYGEAYRTAATRHLWRSTPTELDISYSWQLPHPRSASYKKHNKWQHLSAQASPTPQDIAAGSLEEFITEHYWGYTAHTGLIQRRGATGEYGVAHPRWQHYPIHTAHVQADFGALYGAKFAPLTERQPDHILLAEGSRIAIRSGSHFTA
jgi:uncharacterized protein YqjF (DUF2071 family)